MEDDNVIDLSEFRRKRDEKRDQERVKETIRKLAQAEEKRKKDFQDFNDLLDKRQKGIQNDRPVKRKTSKPGNKNKINMKDIYRNKEGNKEND